MKSLVQIQTEVGKWSLANFGDQESKAVPGLFLGPLAPLLGVVEELGELAEASTDEDIMDACGDVMIYLCDYATREGFRLHGITVKYTLVLRGAPLEQLLKWAGRLCHTTLKYHQGIRDLGSRMVYAEQRDVCVAYIIGFLRNYLILRFGKPCLEEAMTTAWTRVVKKRNWVENPQDGIAAVPEA